MLHAHVQIPTHSPLFLRQSNMKSLEHELHCPVCKEIVKQPVVLPCQHSVCLMCASEILVANGYPPPELPPEPNSPASTPNTRSPRQARRPTPKTEQRPIDRVLRSGVEQLFICHIQWIHVYRNYVITYKFNLFLKVTVKYLAFIKKQSIQFLMSPSNTNMG